MENHWDFPGYGKQLWSLSLKFQVKYRQLLTSKFKQVDLTLTICEINFYTNGATNMTHILFQIWIWVMQPKVWRFVTFASAVVGLLFYALSSSFNYIFGNWNVLKIINRVLDVFETMRDLIPELEFLQNEATAIWKRLGEAIKAFSWSCRMEYAKILKRKQFLVALFIHYELPLYCL